VALLDAMAAGQARHPPLCPVAAHVLKRPLPQRHKTAHGYGVAGRRPWSSWRRQRSKEAMLGN